MTYTETLTVDYATRLYPYVASTEVEIEYEEREGEKEIIGVYVSESVPERLVESIQETARAQFYNL